MALAKTEKNHKTKITPPPKKKKQKKNPEQLTKSVQSCLLHVCISLSRSMLDITYTFDDHLLTGLRPFIYRCDDIIYRRLDPELQLH